MTFFELISTHGTTLTAAAATLIGAALGALHVRSGWITATLGRLGVEVRAVVLEVSQTYTDEVKAAAADGLLTPEERARAKAMALAKLKSNLGKKGLDRIERILGIDSIDDWLSTHIEAAVSDARTVAKPADKPSILALPEAPSRIAQAGNA